MAVTTRTLGRSGIEVGALGMGCWAIGGPWADGVRPLGWGAVDDDESVRAIRRALDLGVNLFDTADTYGAGHGERILGRALAGRRDEAVVATKWGFTFDEATRQATGQDASPEYLRRAVRDSLRRLGTDRIDLYQLHLGDLPVPRAEALIGACEELVADGLVRAYGWSTDRADRAARLGHSAPHATAVQHTLSVLRDAPELLAVCDKYDLASVNRSPLGMGLLTGKYVAGATLPRDDVRGLAPSWLEWFRGGRPAPEWLRRVQAVRAALTADGRTPAQGALGWIWARSERTVPIPGCRTVAQVEENAAALARGPLPPDQFAEVERQLAALRSAALRAATQHP
ncbi:aldo/keto reductase [Micromonospora olivasterospora]|uniref:Aryl-alcohol dehydrogenase-like predicted oxidoreductase n=1 Tax=Micromonospora olivasterospora TaxID=1880 RepID=A0A562IFQ1_MICOL|nr:aldo/keto reductase [Micromonospora olivasterospora]TWH69424.1 aryl-alcohol dehydrogenase-like predicted oxidoreductase [Micromonospora olivasterospora]